MQVSPANPSVRDNGASPTDRAKGAIARAASTTNVGSPLFRNCRTLSNVRTIAGFLLIPLSLLPSVGLHAAHLSSCTEAARYSGKDICVSAHVYDIAQLRDGTRFLDTCSPETSDADCRFAIASLPEDTSDVGNLNALRGKDIELRGTVHSVNDRSLM